MLDPRMWLYALWFYMRLIYFEQIYIEAWHLEQELGRMLFNAKPINRRYKPALAVWVNLELKSLS